MLVTGWGPAEQLCQRSVRSDQTANVSLLLHRVTLEYSLTWVSSLPRLCHIVIYEIITSLFILGGI